MDDLANHFLFLDANPLHQKRENTWRMRRPIIPWEEMAYETQINDLQQLHNYYF